MLVKVGFWRNISDTTLENSSFWLWMEYFRNNSWKYFILKVVHFDYGISVRSREYYFIQSVSLFLIKIYFQDKFGQ